MRKIVMTVLAVLLVAAIVVTGSVISGNTYMVRTEDENGMVYECNVKPFRSSDKSLLNMLLR